MNIILDNKKYGKSKNDSEKRYCVEIEVLIVI